MLVVDTIFLILGLLILIDIILAVLIVLLFDMIDDQDSEDKYAQKHERRYTYDQKSD